MDNSRGGGDKKMSAYCLYRLPGFVSLLETVFSDSNKIVNICRRALKLGM